MYDMYSDIPTQPRSSASYQLVLSLTIFSSSSDAWKLMWTDVCITDENGVHLHLTPLWVLENYSLMA